MLSIRWIPVVLSLVAGCDRNSSQPSPAPSSSAASPAADMPADAAAAASKSGPAVVTHGAGSDQPLSQLPPLEYKHYKDAKFGFSVDVPTFFTADPPSKDQDMQTWNWGKRAHMAASADSMDSSGTSFHDMCEANIATAKGITSKIVKPDECWYTGKDAGRIFWAKSFLKDGKFWGLNLDYDATLKEDFDPLLQHVAVSWVLPKAKP